MNYKIIFKIIKVASLATFLFLLFFINIFAATSAPLSNIINKRSNQIFLDSVRIENTTIIDDRTYIELREFVEKSGYSLIYDDKNQLINVYSTTQPPEIQRETVLFPIIVETSEDKSIIVKTYILDKNDNAAEIETNEFTDNDVLYSLLEMTKEDNPIIEKKMHTEIIQIELETDEINTVLSALGETYKYEDEFGFQGELKLKVDSIRTEIASYRNESYDISEKRSYPNLSSNDLSLIPKIITVNGNTLTLSDVQWTESRQDNIDFTDLGSIFTANAIYTGSNIKRVETGFLITADFTGEINRFDWEKTRYILTFKSVSGNRSDDEFQKVKIEEVVDSSKKSISIKHPFPWGKVFGVMGSGILVIIIISIIVALAYLLWEKVIGKNIIIYQVFSDESYGKLTKMRLSKKNDILDMNLLPIKIREKITENKFIIELTNSVRKRYEDKKIFVKLRNQIVEEYIDPNYEMKKYQFKIDFLE
ncbi:MAG: hypothetical protein LBG48_01910 [Rickettsiales bacterium]|nr:hypothetical protein [Rickettsiales bacterium]MDR2830531.1 hypothetical protein [Candidatus Methanovirga basalitermitum]